MAILFGFNAAAYYHATLLDAHKGAGTADIIDKFGTLVNFTNIMDLTGNFEAESVDTTTRAEAALGWSSEVFTTNNAKISFDMRWEPGSTAFDLLKGAWLARSFVCMAFLDQDKSVNGAQGIAANWSVSFSKNEPVKGLQTVGVQLAVAQYPDWITSNGTVFS